MPGGLTAQDAARGAITLTELVRASDAGPDEEPPEVLVLISPPFGPLGAWAYAPHGELESRGFADAYRRLAEEAQVPLLDLAPFAGVEPDRGIPLRGRRPRGSVAGGGARGRAIDLH